MIRSIKAIKAAFGRLPNSLAAVLLMGCEVSVALIGAAVAIRFAPSGIAGIADPSAFSDFLGSAGVRALVAFTLVSAAIGIAARLKPEGGE